MSDGRLNLVVNSLHTIIDIPKARITLCDHVVYEPASLTVHPPPQKPSWMS